MRKHIYALAACVALALSCAGDDEASAPDAGDAGSGGSAGKPGSRAGEGGAGGGGSGGRAPAAGRGGSTAGSGGSAGRAPTAGRGGSAAESGRSAGDAGKAGAGFAGDMFLPWWGGPRYYEQWPHGLPSDPAFIPIAVWLQTPSNAMRYKAAGINLFVGLWEGPTADQLSTLKTAAVPTVCDQSGVWSQHRDDTAIWGWLQPDEPDNAQAKANGMGYDPCIEPKVIIDGSDKMHTNDASRPVWLGLGRGVSDTQWVGRGTCTGKTDMYKEYQKGGDILSFDIYPVNGGIGLEAVGKGVDNLRGWSDNKKPVVADIEASNIDNTTRPSPAQIKAEVWLALTHGAAGVQYFCHRFSPTFSETDCLDDKPTANALLQINRQVSELARVLNTPSVGNGVSVKSDKPIDAMLKRDGDVTYLFAVQVQNATTNATFQLERFPSNAAAEVLGENRVLDVRDGVLTDDFGAYAVHLYKISAR